MKTLIDFSDKGFNDYECLQQAKVLNTIKHYEAKLETIPNKNN